MTACSAARLLDVARGDELVVRHLRAGAVLDALSRLHGGDPLGRHRRVGAPSASRARSPSACSTSRATRASTARTSVPAADRRREVRRSNGFEAVWTPERHLRLRRALPEPRGHRRGSSRRSRERRSAPVASRCCTTRSGSPRTGRWSTTCRAAASASRSPLAGTAATSCCVPRTSRTARVALIRTMEQVHALWRGES